MYCQLSFKVKLIVIVKSLVCPSAPEAITVEEDDDRGKAPLQAPVPMEPPMWFTDTFVQLAVTADAGTAVHPENEEETAWTPTVQVLASLPAVRLKETVAMEEPATIPRSGSVAEKLMVAGVALIVVMPVAATLRAVLLGLACAVRVFAPPRAWAWTRPVAMTAVMKTVSVASWNRKNIAMDSPQKLPISLPNYVALMVSVTVAENPPVW